MQKLNVSSRASSRMSLTPHRGYNSAMIQRVPITGAVLLVTLLAALPARTQNPQPRADEDCGDIGRNYELIKAQAVSIQINMALFKAADKGCEALARGLIDAGASLLARDRRGASPLAHAARAGQIKLVQLFLADGAPIDARNVDGSTALLAAAEAEKHSTVSLLLAKGADPNLPGHKGVTPLMAAAFKGNGRIFEALLARGADANARDDTGKSAMVYAASRGFDDIVGRLLDAGVDARARYGNDLAALMWAAGHDEGVGAAAVGRVVDLLLAHGASLDDTDNRGRTALMIAAELGDAAVVDLLLERGADRTLKDKQSKTARDLAATSEVRAKLTAK